VTDRIIITKKGVTEVTDHITIIKRGHYTLKGNIPYGKEKESKKDSSLREDCWE